MEDIAGHYPSIRVIVKLKSKFKDSMNLLKPYTVRYRSFDNGREENCFYASDSFEARMLAMEFNKYIHDHPNCIDLIRCEEKLLSTIKG